MLGQSNPPQTRQPLPSLDFADRDLTDAFTDQRDGSHSSISGLGHPRGSTPISALSSRRSTPSNGFSIDSPQSRRTLPNMTALLDFLDDDHPNPLLNNTRHSNPTGPRNKPIPNRRKSNQPVLNHRSSPSVDQSSSKTTLISHRSPNPVTPRVMAPRDLDLTPNLSKNTYENSDGNRFRGLMPTSSTPFTNPSHHHEGLTPDQSSEISSPLKKRHPPNGFLQSNLQFVEYSHQTSPVQTSACASPRLDPPRVMSLNQVSGRPLSSQSDRVVGGGHHDLPSETPARVASKLPSAADRLAAAVMEGAPESHWTFLVEPQPPQLDGNPTAGMTTRTGIRRSKVVEELLQPMRPSLSSPAGQIPHDQIIDSPRSAKDSDLPQSLIDEARRTCRARSPSFIPSAASDPSGCQSRLSKSARYSSAPNLIRPTPQRPPTFSPTHHAQDANLTHPSSASEQVQVLDARVNQLLSHIRSDQLEKANLVAALAEARSEVAALRDEVRLLRVGVQKLGENQPYRSADGRLEHIPAILNTQGQHPPKSLVEERGLDTPPGVPKRDGSSHHSQRSQSFKAPPPHNPHPEPARNLPNRSKESCSSPRQPDDHLQPPDSILTNDDLDAYLNKPKKLPVMAKEALNQETSFGQLNGRHQSMDRKFGDDRRNTESSIQDLSKRFLGDLALGLTFTRCVDYLIMNPTSFISSSPSYPPDQYTRNQRSRHRDQPGGHPPRFRSDSDIFDPVNLDRLFTRLKVWKLLVLRSSSLTPTSHPDPPSTDDLHDPLHDEPSR